MALKKAKKKSVKKGAKVSSVKTTTKVKATKTKPAKGGKVKGALKSVGGVLDRAMGAYTGSTLGDLKADYKKGAKRISLGGKRRKKGVVPKTVRKWASKITKRRKQEEKIVKKLFGAEGGKIMKKAKTSRYGTPGVISRAEAMEAMRR